MFLKGAAAFAAILLLLPTVASAGPKHVIHPVQLGNESVRYFQGVPTIDQVRERGAVQLTPLALSMAA